MVKNIHTILFLLVLSFGCQSAQKNQQSSVKAAAGEAYFCMEQGNNLCIKFWKTENQEGVPTTWFETKNDIREVHKWSYAISFLADGNNTILLTSPQSGEVFGFHPRSNNRFAISRKLGSSPLRYLKWSGQPIWSDEGSATSHFLTTNGQLSGIIDISNGSTGVPPPVPPPPPAPVQPGGGGGVVPPVSGRNLKVCYVADIFGNTVNPYKCVTPDNQIKDNNNIDNTNIPFENLTQTTVNLNGNQFYLVPVRIQMTDGAEDKRSGFVLRDATGEGCLLAKSVFQMSRDLNGSDHCGLFQLFVDNDMSSSFTQQHYNSYYTSISNSQGSPCDPNTDFGGIPTCVMPNSGIACVQPGQYCPPIICSQDRALQFCGANRYCKAANTGFADSCEDL